MGADTTAKLFGSPTVLQIASVIRGSFNTATEVEHWRDDMFRIYFSDPIGKQPGAADRRMMFVLPQHDGDEGDPISGKHTHCILGAWGGSVQVMNALASRFGGYVMDNDCADMDWRFVASSEGHEPSAADKLRLRLEQALGSADAVKLIAIMDDPDKRAAVLAAYAEYPTT